MLDIETTINSMKRRPLMFVSELRLDLMFYFLTGVLTDSRYMSAHKITKDFYTDFFNWVYDWAKQEDKSYTYNGKFWHRMIYDNTNSEEEAVGVFFELCEDYFKHWYEGQ